MTEEQLAVADANPQRYIDVIVRIYEWIKAARARTGRVSKGRALKPGIASTPKVGRLY
jgi:hypothetical protein